ncbi:hypothetical protein O97_00887, partial [Bartonella henselae str. Zeus]
MRNSYFFIREEKVFFILDEGKNENEECI